jgi:hypothetical protein
MMILTLHGCSVYNTVYKTAMQGGFVLTQEKKVLQNQHPYDLWGRLARLQARAQAKYERQAKWQKNRKKVSRG